MSAEAIPTVRYSEARDEGNVTHEDGYHQPVNGRTGSRACPCELDTQKGAYRDVTIQMPSGLTLHYYHQSPVVVVLNGRYRLDSHGYRTPTTKQRINRYLPSGYRVVQRDHEWHLQTYDPDGSTDQQDKSHEPFEDGMTIKP